MQALGRDWSRAGVGLRRRKQGHVFCVRKRLNTSRPAHRVGDAGVPDKVGHGVGLGKGGHAGHGHDDAGGEAEVCVVLPALLVFGAGRRAEAASVWG